MVEERGYLRRYKWTNNSYSKNLISRILYERFAWTFRVEISFMSFDYLILHCNIYIFNTIIKIHFIVLDNKIHVKIERNSIFGKEKISDLKILMEYNPARSNINLFRQGVSFYKIRITYIRSDNFQLKVTLKVPNFSSC